MATPPNLLLRPLGDLMRDPNNHPKVTIQLFIFYQGKLLLRYFEKPTRCDIPTQVASGESLRKTAVALALDMLANSIQERTLQGIHFSSLVTGEQIAFNNPADPRLGILLFVTSANLSPRSITNSLQWKEHFDSKNNKWIGQAGYQWASLEDMSSMPLDHGLQPQDVAVVFEKQGRAIQLNNRIRSMPVLHEQAKKHIRNICGIAIHIRAKCKMTEDGGFEPIRYVLVALQAEPDARDTLYLMVADEAIRKQVLEQRYRIIENRSSKKGGGSTLARYNIVGIDTAGRGLDMPEIPPLGFFAEDGSLRIEWIQRTEKTTVHQRNEQPVMSRGARADSVVDGGDRQHRMPSKDGGDTIGTPGCN